MINHTALYKLLTRKYLRRHHISVAGNLKKKKEGKFFPDKFGVSNGTLRIPVKTYYPKHNVFKN
jgi:hypothetical protein